MCFTPPSCVCVSLLNCTSTRPPTRPGLYLCVILSRTTRTTFLYYSIRLFIYIEILLIYIVIIYIFASLHFYLYTTTLTSSLAKPPYFSACHGIELLCFVGGPQITTAMLILTPCIVVCRHLQRTYS